MKKILVPLLFLLSTSAFAEKCCVPRVDLADEFYDLAQVACAHPYLNQGHPDDAATPGNYYYGRMRCEQIHNGYMVYLCEWSYGDPDCKADEPSHSSGSDKPMPDVSPVRPRKK